MKILAIDGGGIRGIYAAHMLQRIQEEFDVNYSEYFDLIAGTSTGSIIAAALATNIPIKQVVSFYENSGKDIFSLNRLGYGGYFRARYKSKKLGQILSDVFGKKTLSDTSTNLIIPATDIANARVHVFKSTYDREFVRDKDVLISDAVLASCSAPTYFNPHTVSQYLLADGGMWANNPTLTGLVEAKKRFNKELSEVNVLSIGTGIGNQYYKHKAPKIFYSWGLLTRWGRSKLIDAILNLQSQSIENTVNLLLPPENILRINFQTDSKLSLDSIEDIADFKSRADKDFTYLIKEIGKFI